MNIKPIFKQTFRDIFLLFLYFMTTALSISNPGHAQNVVSGTDFNAVPSRQNAAFISLADISQYGALTGTLTATVPLHTSFSSFSKDYGYMVVNNPVRIDSSRYFNELDYVFAVSPAPDAPSVFLKYSLSGLQPHTHTNVLLTFSSIVDPVKANASNQGFDCSDQYASFEVLAGVTVAKAYDYVLEMGRSMTVNIPVTADASGKIDLSFLTLNSNMTCAALAISKIEVTGFTKVSPQTEPEIETCTGEQVTLRPRATYNGTYQWEYQQDNSWIAFSTSASATFNLATAGVVNFRLWVTPAGASERFLAENRIARAVECCASANGAGSGRQTIFYDDFGTLDLSDSTGKTYWTWDYSTDPTSPKRVRRTTATPFRWNISNPPNHTFKPVGPVEDGQYTIAAYLTNYQPYQGFAGARLEWASGITGPMIIPPISFDHSGKREGALLLINNAFNSSGNVIYNRTMNNLCTVNGNKAFFECYISVFTSSPNGVDISVKLTSGSNVVTLNGQACAERGTCGSPGKWVKIFGQIMLEGNILQMQIINNAPNNWNINGNDLAIDDIRILSCAPPSASLFSDSVTLAEKDTLCGEDLNFIVSAGSNAAEYYKGEPYYLLQYSKTPADLNSWKNVTQPQSDPEFSVTATSEPFAGAVKGDKVYFRVVIATPQTFDMHQNFEGSVSANPDNPCRSYSVTAPFEVLVDLSASCNTTAVAEEVIASASLIFPNPSGRDFNLGKQVIHCKVINALGQVMSEGSSATIQTDEWPEGLYIAYLKLDNGKLVIQKIVKE